MTTNTTNIRQKITKQEGWISILVNILLFVIKYMAGIASGSLALIADAWHTLSDSISSILVLISARYSYKQADKDHPFGHGRFELVTSIFIGVLLILVGINFIKEGVAKFIDHEEAVFGTFAIVASVFSILMKEGLAQFAFWGYRKTNSSALKADGWHHRSDAISSIVILVGIFIGKYLWWIDAVMSVIVAGFLLYAAYEIVKSSISSILGEPPSVDLIQKVSDLANQTVGYDVMVHHVHLHDYVIHRELTFHICLPPTLTIETAHEITDEIEKTIKEEMEIESTIHIDPNSIKMP